MRGISGLRITFKIERILPDLHRHRIFPGDPVVYISILRDNILEEIEVVHPYIVVDSKPFLFVGKCSDVKKTRNEKMSNSMFAFYRSKWVIL